MMMFNRSYNKNIFKISDEFKTFIRSYDFPGNIRELKNILERAFVFCDGTTLHLHHLSDEYISWVSNNLKNSAGISCLTGGDIEKSYNEKNAIIKTIEQCKGNKTKAAEILKIDKTTLWRKIKKHRLDHLLKNSLMINNDLHGKMQEKDIIAQTLKITNNNKAKAAKILNMDRTTLWRKLKKYFGCILSILNFADNLFLL